MRLCHGKVGPYAERNGIATTIVIKHVVELSPEAAAAFEGLSRAADIAKSERLIAERKQLLAQMEAADVADGKATRGGSMAATAGSDASQI